MKIKKIILPLIMLLSFKLYSQDHLSEDSDDFNAIIKSDTNGVNSDIKVYLSVLRYKNEIIDIYPISRNSTSNDQYNQWDFNEFYHKFKKEKISADDALILISKHQWQINEIFIYNEYLRSDSDLPNFFSRKTEVMIIKE